MTFLKVSLVLLGGCAMLLGGFFTAIYAETEPIKTIAKVFAVLGLVICALGVLSAFHFLGQM